MQMTLVSVVIPVYNGELYLGEAIASVLAQTHRNFELIIVDDGSTDSTPDIAVEFASRDSRIICHIHPINRGVAAALNTGLRIAKGEWVTPLGHDDVMLSNRLAAQLEFHALAPEAKVFGHGSAYVTMTGHACGFALVQPLFSANDLNAFLQLGGTVAVHHPMMHRETVLSVGGYNEALRFSEDQDLWLRLLQAGHIILNHSDVLTKYRIHSTSLTVQSANSSGVITQWIEARYMAWRAGRPEPKLDEFVVQQKDRPLLRRLADRRRSLGWGMYRKAGTSLVNRRWIPGMRDLVAAFCLRPLYVLGRLTRQLRST